jgi:hypothetical protein
MAASVLRSTTRRRRRRVALITKDPTTPFTLPRIDDASDRSADVRLTITEGDASAYSMPTFISLTRTIRKRSFNDICLPMRSPTCLRLSSTTKALEDIDMGSSPAKRCSTNRLWCRAWRVCSWLYFSRSCGVFCTVVGRVFHFSYCL